MAKSTYPVLCGGTVFTLVLAAKKEGPDKRSQYKGKLSEFSQPEILAGLGRVVYPEYTLSGNKKVQSTNATAYRSCENDGPNLAFLYPQAVSAFDTRVTTDYQSALLSMYDFTSRFLEVGTSLSKEVWLVKALLDLIESDANIDAEQLFYLGDNGEPVTKAALRSLTDFSLQSVLLGVWHYAVVCQTDNKAGKETFDRWCPPDGSKRKREYRGNLGDSITRPISVRMFDPEAGVTEQSSKIPKNDTKHVAAARKTNAMNQLPPGINKEYYNLIVTTSEIKNYRTVILKQRILTSDADFIQRFADFSVESQEQLKRFPSLIMNENTKYSGQTDPEQIAFLGFIKDIKVQQNNLVRIKFQCIAEIPQVEINNHLDVLDIFGGNGIMELNHTHWTIKNNDLIEELTELGLLPHNHISEAII